jgi:hypothetical protein
MRFGYSQSVDTTMPEAAAQNGYDEKDLEPDAHARLGSHNNAKGERREPAWLKWTSQIMSYVAVSSMGFVLGVLLLIWRWGPAHELGQMVINHPVQTCERILQLAPIPSGDASGSGAQPGGSPRPNSAPAEKGSRGKY